ncbi:MAG: ferredoxin, partial [Solirubrobacteraceae bacterium]|nr:ferredoxin [Solirubrobacteraceae bacterium]
RPRPRAPGPPPGRRRGSPGADSYGWEPMTEVSARNRIAIDVDRTLCFGFGDCVDTAPAVFALDDEDVAYVIDPDAADVDLIVEASQNCPVDAIIICDELGVQLYP